MATSAGQITIAVFGDKGCGKSTLCGRLCRRYGDFDDEALKKAKEAIKKYERKENCEYAFLCDTHDNDRKNGTSGTHLLGFQLTINKSRQLKQEYTIIDSGSSLKNRHRLVRGAFGQSQIGILLLEINNNDMQAFKDSISSKSDIYQYLVICHAFGVQKLLIALNKADSAQHEVDANLYEECKQSIQATLNSIGYNADNVPVIPISGYYGDNVFKASTRQSLSWWTGFEIASKSQHGAKTHQITTLLKGIKYLSLKSKPLATKNLNAPMILTVKSRLEVRGVGTVFLSRVDQGQLSKNQTVLCCKARHEMLVKRYTVKSIQSHGKDREVARMGDIIGFTVDPPVSELPKKDQPQIEDVFCSPDKFKMQLVEALKNTDNIDYKQTMPVSIKYVAKFTALIEVLPEEVTDGQKQTLQCTHKYSHELFFRTQTLQCCMQQILLKCTRKEKEKEWEVDHAANKQVVSNGEQAEVVFNTKHPHLVTTYNAMRSYASFVIMKNKKPIAIGKVVAVTN